MGAPIDVRGWLRRLAVFPESKSQDSMRLIVLQDEAMIADVVCGREAVYIGSRESCRVHLPDPRVAIQQAIVYPSEADEWVVEQLDARCEIKLNGSVVQDRHGLKTGDEIQILDYAIRVHPEYEDPGLPRAAQRTSRAALERFAQAVLPPGTILKKADEPITIQPQHMAAIARANTAAGGCTTVEELMDVALQTLFQTFAAHRAWIGIRRLNYGPMDYVEGRLITGQPADMPAIDEDLKPRVLDRAQFAMVPVISREDRTSVLAGPLLGPESVLGMVHIDSGASGRRFDVRDLDFFVVVLHVLAAQLEAIFKTLARTRAAMIDGQVTVAHETQVRLTPRKLPQSDELSFSAFREPGRQRANDIYDVVRLQNGVVAVMVAHTPTTGALPSILMTQVQTTFRYAAMHQDAPHVFLRSLNWLLFDGQKDHPLECFAAMIDPPTGKMRFAVAGESIGAYIIGQRGEERALAPSEPAPALGMAKNPAYALLPEQLEPSETVALFTPGVTTAKNSKEETFGRERFVNILCDGFGQLPSTMMKEMLTDLRSFTEGGSQPDDITIVLAHRV